MAYSAILLKPNVANFLLFKFCEQKFIQRSPITIAIDCNGLFWLIFEEIWLNYASVLKSAPNSDLFWVRRFFNEYDRVFCTSNATMSFMGKDDFFFAKIGIFCKSIADQISEAYTTIFVLRCGCVGFSMYACWFSVAQIRQFCLFTYPPRSK